MDIVQIMSNPLAPRTGTVCDLWRGERASLFTCWGTHVYYDHATKELRHGIADRPKNTVLLSCGTPTEESDQAVLAIIGEGGVHFVTSDNGRLTVLSCEEPLDVRYKTVHTRFSLVPVDQDRVGLRAQSLFLCAEQDGRLTLSKTRLRAWETF